MFGNVANITIKSMMPSCIKGDAPHEVHTAYRIPEGGCTANWRGDVPQTVAWKAMAYEELVVVVFYMRILHQTIKPLPLLSRWIRLCYVMTGTSLSISSTGLHEISCDI